MDIDEQKDNLIEEYKTLRQEILEIDKRKNNLIVYTIIATATIFGFAIEFPSAYIFLLPLIMVIPLSYKVQSLEDSILHIGTYISVVIEQHTNLQWETYLKKLRKAKEGKFLRQLPNYIIFDLLGAACFFGSMGYEWSLGHAIPSSFSELILAVIEFSQINPVLIFCWVAIPIYFVFWTRMMRNCFSSEAQSSFEEEIKEIINPKESTN